MKLQWYGIYLFYLMKNIGEKIIIQLILSLLLKFNQLFNSETELILSENYIKLFTVIIIWNYIKLLEKQS